MSTRAYKLISIKTSAKPTFNLSHNYNILHLADNEDLEILTFQVENLKEALTKSNYTEEEKEIIKKMIKEAKNNDFVEYYTY